MTPFIVRRPVFMIRPSASTTSRPSAESLVTPYFTQRSPPALVARLPPMVEISYEDGSGAYMSPCSLAARSRSAVMTPGSTTAISSAGDSSLIAVILASDSTMEPSPATEAPASPVPPPLGTTGTRCSVAQRRVVTTSSREAASTTPSGLPGSRNVRSRA